MIKNIKRDITLGKQEFIFYAAWFVFLLATMIEHTSLDQSDILLKVTKLARYGAYALCAINIYKKFFLKGKIIGIIGMAIILALSMLGSTNKTMFLYIFLIVGATGLIAQKIIALSFVTMGLLWFAIISCSQIGILEDYIFDPGKRDRHSLGFSWTTTGAILYFYLVLQYVYLRKKKITYIEIMLLEIVNIVLYKLTDSRMAFLLLTLYLVTIVFVKIGKNKWFWVEKFKNLFVAVPTIFAVLSVALHHLYNPSNALWTKLNDLLSGRLKLGRDAISDYGYSLFGQKIEWVGFSLENLTTEGYNYVDCSYLKLLLEYGLFFLIVVVFLYSLLMYKALKQKNYYLLWSTLFVLILSITEPRLMNLAFNPFPVIFLAEVERGD